MKTKDEQRKKALKNIFDTRESLIESKIIDSPTSDEYKIRHEKSLEEEREKTLSKEYYKHIDFLVN